MLKVGIIGAGHISTYHISSYQKLENCTVKAICDLTKELAEERAQEYGIEYAYSDYNDILNDSEIDAVSVVTPTFTHKKIVMDALKAGKHVLCEKPPALNADEVAECEEFAKETGKLLMYGFVGRFSNADNDVMDFINSGKLGTLVSADCERTHRCNRSEGWFASRAKGGGALRDECIHELDGALYFMGYPEPVAVIASETFANSDLPSKRVNSYLWKAYDKTVCERDVESAIEGFITFKNGTSLHIKSSSVMNVVDENVTISLVGENGGIKIYADRENNKYIKSVELVGTEFKENDYACKVGYGFADMIAHFADCVANGTECRIKSGDATKLMRIVDAMYESAATRKPVVF